MLTIEIPGREPLDLHHVVLDYNGTIAVDGSLLAGVAERPAKLRDSVSVTVLTADTYGTVRPNPWELLCGRSPEPEPRCARKKSSVRWTVGFCASAMVLTIFRCLTQRRCAWPCWSGKACARHCCLTPMCWSLQCWTRWIC